MRPWLVSSPILVYGLELKTIRRMILFIVNTTSTPKSHQNRGLCSPPAHERENVIPMLFLRAIHQYSISPGFQMNRFNTQPGFPVEYSKLRVFGIAAPTEAIITSQFGTIHRDPALCIHYSSSHKQFFTATKGSLEWIMMPSAPPLVTYAFARRKHCARAVFWPL